MKFVPTGSLSLSVAALAAAAVAIAAVGTDLPGWAPDAVLAPFLAWLGLEVVKQGRAIKRLPDREEIAATRAEVVAMQAATLEVQRDLFEQLALLGAKLADNTARIDAQRHELDELSGQMRRLGEQVYDGQQKVIDRVTTLLLDLEDKTNVERRRLEDRVKEIEKHFSRRRP